MEDFSFRARVTFEGVVIVVRANSSEEAKAKAEAGDWADTELHTADRADWKIGRPCDIA